MDNQAPAPITEEKSKDWFKVLQIIIGFLIVLGLFGNIYLLLRKEKQKPISQITPTPTQTSLPRDSEEVLRGTPTPDETANWKTYKNKLYKFQFKYPSSWFPMPEINNTISVKSTDPKLGGNLSGFSVQIRENPKGLELKEWWHSSFGTVTEYVIQREKELKQIEVASQPALRLEPDAWPENQAMTEIFVTKDKKIYYITLVTDIEKPEENTINNLILSTFKFLD